MSTDLSQQSVTILVPPASTLYVPFSSWLRRFGTCSGPRSPQISLLLHCRCRFLKDISFLFIAVRLPWPSRGSSKRHIACLHLARSQREHGGGGSRGGRGEGDQWQWQQQRQQRRGERTQCRGSDEDDHRYARVARFFAMLFMTNSEWERESV